MAASSDSFRNGACVVGIDVGGSRKRFDAAVLHNQGPRLVLDPPRKRQTLHQLVDLVRAVAPRIVAIDSPVSPAADRMKSRPCEKLLAARICGIRYTPDAQRLAASPRYYDWIVRGFALYDALHPILGPTSSNATYDARLIEVFPTASWTRLDAARKGTRPKWTSEVLQRHLERHIGISGIPPQHNQDTRDAICAACTAWLYNKQLADLTFWPIVVPT